MRIGILGGTFDPPHIGHLRLAEETAPLFGLDRVLFMPCHLPPHKRRSHMAPPGHRLEMTRLACSDNPLFDVSDMEIAAKGLSYTVTTLEIFAANNDYETFFILGTDSLREIHTWKDYERLFGLAHFIVVTRPGVDFGTAWAALPEEMRGHFREDGSHMVHESSKRVVPAEITGLNISSTKVRRLLREGKSVRYLVTEQVRSYLIKWNLYRNQ